MAGRCGIDSDVFHVGAWLVGEGKYNKRRQAEQLDLFAIEMRQQI